MVMLNPPTFFLISLKFCIFLLTFLSFFDGFEFGLLGNTTTNAIIKSEVRAYYLNEIIDLSYIRRKQIKPTETTK
jgi:hypothetical protein